jgi:uncharacterized membrane protein HdeD (DUF308 family)
MSFLRKFSDEHLPSFQKSGRKFVFIGIILLILGCIAVSAAVLTTLISLIFLGVVLMVGGLMMLFDSMAFWRRKHGFFVHTLISLLYVAAGVALVVNPIAAAIPLTLLLGIFYIIAGIFRVSFASGVQTPLWGWAWFNGIISLLIGVLIITSWPASSLFIIGLFVGIDLIFAGWAYVMLGVAGRKSVKKRMAKSSK